jgi:hypothetical protein
MSLSFLTPARCVLLIGDETLSVFDVNSKRTRLLESIPWEEEDLEERVASIIKRDMSGKPVLVLNDMTDQHFKGGQRLPKVGPLDKPGVLKRRLQVAFPNYPIRGALPVKERKDGNGKKSSGMYLFAAVPMSEPVQRTIAAVRLSLSPVAGFCLLPIESSDMVKKLSHAASKRKGKTPAHWSVFIGQHKGGALRQVIVRDGQLAMTRMTPISEIGSSPKAWAEEVLQEFKATISYLSRFGYTAKDGTDVILVSDKEAGDELQEILDVPCNLYPMTTGEAAGLLGVRLGMEAEQDYTDPLHVAWAGVKSSFELPLDTPDLDRIHKPRQVATFVILLLLLGFGAGAWQLMNEAQSLYTLKDEIETKQRIKADVDLKLQSELERMKQLGYDVRLIGGALQAFNEFEKEELKPLYFVDRIGEALGPQLRLDNLEVNYIPLEKKDIYDPYYTPPAEGSDQSAKMEAALYLSFPPSIDPEEGFTEVKNLERRLASYFPLHDVSIEKQVAERVYTGSVSGESSAIKEQEQRTEKYTAQINIRGPAQ